jgi:hypothetical protein
MCQSFSLGNSEANFYERLPVASAPQHTLAKIGSSQPIFD